MLTETFQNFQRKALAGHLKKSLRECPYLSEKEKPPENAYFEEIFGRIPDLIASGVPLEILREILGEIPKEHSGKFFRNV